MAVKSFVQAIPRSSISSAAIGGAYAAINAGGLPEACFLIRIINDSTAGIDISYDGVNDHDFVRDDDVLQIGFQTNSQPNNQTALLKKGTVIYVSGTPGVGTIYLVGYFQDRS